jgi:hypothetical protein
MNCIITKELQDEIDPKGDDGGFNPSRKHINY